MSTSQADRTEGKTDGDVNDDWNDYGDHAGEKGVLAPFFSKFQVSLFEGTVGKDWKHKNRNIDKTF